IDQAAAEAALALGEMIEVDTRGVLIEPRCDHVLGVFDGDADDMIDPVALGVITEAVRAAGKFGVVLILLDDRTAIAERADIDAARQFGHDLVWRGRLLVAL